MTNEGRQRDHDLRGRVIRATFVSILVPGAGHWRCRKLLGRYIGPAILAVTMLGGAAVALHLWRGLAAFESPLGSFLFGVLLRGLIILYAFAVIDAYLSSHDPEHQAGIRRRQAIILNLLVPGTGYLRSKAWPRALSGLAVLGILLAFADLRYHRFLDLVYIAAQLTMAASVWQQLSSAEYVQQLAQGPRRTPLDPVAPAQIAALVIATIAFFACALVVQLRMPPQFFAQVSADDVVIRPTSSGIGVEVEPLRLSFFVKGDGWVAEAKRPGWIFSAHHERQATLRVGTNQILPFVKPQRYAARLGRKMAAAGYKLLQTRTTTINRRPALQMQLSRAISSTQTLERWMTVFPYSGYAVLLVIECNQLRCAELRPQLDATRESLKGGALGDS